MWSFNGVDANVRSEPAGRDWGKLGISFAAAFSAG
jgi:hypothetical protein